MTHIINFILPDYDSEPEPELSVDEQLENFLNPTTGRADGSKCSTPTQRQGLRRRSSDMKTGVSRI